MLKEVCEHECLSYTQVFKRFKIFKGGRERTEDDAYPGRPSLHIKNGHKHSKNESVEMKNHHLKIVALIEIDKEVFVRFCM